jgi:hypothetical protein
VIEYRGSVHAARVKANNGAVSNRAE